MLVKRLRRWPDTETALGDGQCMPYGVMQATLTHRWVNGNTRETEQELVCQYWANVGSASYTVGQHTPSIGSTSRV